jgi:hypothetical protein
MVLSSLEKYQYASCFGNWALRHPECAKCSVADRCEKKTKSDVGDAGTAPTARASPTEHGHLPPDPFDYMIKRLEGQFDLSFEDRSGVRVYKFSRGSKIVVVVVVGITGAVKILNKGRSRTIGKIADIGSAESILAEIQ